MGTLTRRSTTPTPRSSRIPPPCQAAKRRRRLPTLRQHQPSPLSSLDSLLLNRLVGHPNILLLNQAVDREVEGDHLNSHLLNKAMDKQVGGSLRTGGIPHGEVEAARVKAGKITTGRIALRGVEEQAPNLPEQAPSLLEKDKATGAAVVGVGVGAGVDVDGVPRRQAGLLLPMIKPARNSTRWERWETTVRRMTCGSWSMLKTAGMMYTTQRVSKLILLLGAMDLG